MENYESQPYQTNPQQNPNFMQSKLPNATASMVLGILSILCCCSGFIGIILGIIGLVLANKDIKTYQSNPQMYTGIQNVNTARILNIIGLVIGVLSLVYSLWAIYFQYGGWDGYMQEVRTIMEQAQNQ